MALAKVSFGKNSKRIKSDYCLSRQIGCEGEKQLSFRKTKTIFKLSQQTRLSALFIGWDQACGSNLRQIPFCAKEIKKSWGLALALNKKLYIYELELMTLRRSCEFTQKLVLSLLNIESIWNPVASVAFRSNGKLDKLIREATWIVQDEGVIWKPIESSWKSRIEVDSSWMKSQWMEYDKTQWYYIHAWSVGMWRKIMRIMYHNEYF